MIIFLGLGFAYEALYLFLYLLTAERSWVRPLLPLIPHDPANCTLMGVSVLTQVLAISWETEPKLQRYLANFRIAWIQVLQNVGLGTHRSNTSGAAGSRL